MLNFDLDSFDLIVAFDMLLVCMDGALFAGLMSLFSQPYPVSVSRSHCVVKIEVPFFKLRSRASALILNSKSG